jgi:hypothetical protein
MARNLLSTATESLRSLLANGKRYEVPRYQRDYSWTIENWEDLWIDLEEVADGERQHYMGALVLQETSTETYRIIDGQQRIATLSVLILAALHCLHEMVAAGHDPDDNKERVELLRSAFLGARDPVSLQTIPKLTLGASNRQFYDGTLLQLRTPPSVSALRHGERALWDALVYFRDKLRERFVKKGDGKGLAEFIYETVAAKLLFIHVTVDDELGAYAVFETLNARGLELSPGDLLKNYILSLVHKSGESNLDLAQRTWQQLVERVPNRRLPDFLRHVLSTDHRDVRRERVFKLLRSDIQQPDQAFELLQRLDELSILASALDDAEHPFWSDLPAARDHVRHLILYGATQYRPVVFAAWKHLSHDHLPPILRDLATISFRYSVIGQLNPNQLERTYNDVAVRITQGDLTASAAIREALRAVCPADDEFRQAFSKKSISVRNRRKLVRHILCSIEKQIYGTDIDGDSTEATIEHVLPESPAPEWPNFLQEQHERYVDRLGNYLLLEPRLNRDVANRSFTDKLTAYQTSKYESAKQFSFDEWTPQKIEQRQQQMARTATAIWRFP